MADKTEKLLASNSRKRRAGNSNQTKNADFEAKRKKSKYFSSKGNTKNRELDEKKCSSSGKASNKLSASPSASNSSNLRFSDCDQEYKKFKTFTNAHSKDINNSQIGREFYSKPTEELAKSLLGKVLYRVLESGEVLSGRIVETEAYLGEIDKACHSYGGKKTERTKPMFMAPGTAYVYIIYGMYHCFNISSGDNGACVLIRALEPISGLETMRKFRGSRRSNGGVDLKEKQISNGPSKLCQALCIEKANLNTEDMAVSSRFWIGTDDLASSFQTVTTTRIGINSYGKEWANKPLRFYILGNKSISVRDKEQEAKQT